jgi:hypothetical protein
MESLTCAIGSFLLGIVGWFAVGFFEKPLLDFLNLRSQVHEEIIFTGKNGPVARRGKNQGYPAYTSR